jgi:hypothetical protein
MIQSYYGHADGLLWDKQPWNWNPVQGGHYKGQVPTANDLTCYRIGDGKREHGSCSYFAPLTRFAVKPGFVWEYDVYLTVGRDEEIRLRFQQLAK